MKPLAVVTGASSGIGRELAKQFADNGFDLLITSEDASLAEAANELEAKGCNVEQIQVDLANYDGVEQLYYAIEKAGRPIEALVLNAGIGAGGNFCSETSLDAELKIIELNIASTVHLAKRVIPDMVRQGSGRVLITSSIAAVMPGPFEAVYAASKAFGYSFGEAIRNELLDTGVTVTILMPGPTDTNFFERANMQNTKAATGHKDDPADVAREGFEAMMAGDDHVIAGSVKNKLQGIVGKFLPETTKAKQHRQLTEPSN